jgi:hypothetical protein
MDNATISLNIFRVWGFVDTAHFFQLRPAWLTETKPALFHPTPAWIEPRRARTVHPFDVCLETLTNHGRFRGDRLYDERRILSVRFLNGLMNLKSSGWPFNAADPA